MIPLDKLTKLHQARKDASSLRVKSQRSLRLATSKQNRLSAQEAKVTKEIKSEEARLSSIFPLLVQAKSRLDSVTRLIADVSARIAREKSSISSVKGEIQDLDDPDMKAAAESRLNILNDNVKEFTLQEQARGETAKVVKRDVDKHEAAKSRVEGRLQAKIAQKISIGESLADVRATIDKLQAEFDKLQKAEAEAISALDAETDRLRVSLSRQTKAKSKPAAKKAAKPAAKKAAKPAAKKAAKPAAKKAAKPAAKKAAKPAAKKQ